jgi:hypothetical protein
MAEIGTLRVETGLAEMLRVASSWTSSMPAARIAGTQALAR